MPSRFLHAGCCEQCQRIPPISAPQPCKCCHFLNTNIFFNSWVAISAYFYLITASRPSQTAGARQGSKHLLLSLHIRPGWHEVEMLLCCFHGHCRLLLLIPLIRPRHPQLLLYGLHIVLSCQGADHMRSRMPCTSLFTLESQLCCAFWPRSRLEPCDIGRGCSIWQPDSQ